MGVIAYCYDLLKSIYTVACCCLDLHALLASLIHLGYTKENGQILNIGLQGPGR